MQDPRSAVQVSVILSLYNGQRFLAPALDSVFAQSFRDFELIVVDDGSTDESVDVLARYHDDARLQVLRQPNAGAAAALQKGLHTAAGKYVAFLDQDDLWEVDNLASHVEFLERRPEIEMTFSWFRVIDEHGQETGMRSHRYRGRIGFPELLADFVIGANSNLMFRRTAIERAGGIDTSLRYVFNVDLCLRVGLLSPNGNISAIPRDLMSYRRHGGQLSRDRDPIREEWLRVFEKMRVAAPDVMAAVEPYALANLDRYGARQLYADALYREALEKLATAFRRAPLYFVVDRRNWLTGAASLSGLLLPDAVHRKLERICGYQR